MNLKTCTAFLILFASLLSTSCSDAEIVSGIYKGKIYRTDTVNAFAHVVKVNDGMVRIEVKPDGENNGYVEYAQLTKNADEAYNLIMMIDTNIVLSGYYYENWMHINALSSSFVFEGQSP